MRRPWLNALLLLGAGLAFAAFAVRLSRSAEAVAWFGTPQERADLCRALPALSSWRRTRILSSLLRDEVLEVRLSAIETCARTPPEPALDSLLLNLYADEALDVTARSKAGLVLLSRPGASPEFLKTLDNVVTDRAFHTRFPELLARYLEINLSNLDAAGRRRLLDEATDSDEPAAEAVRELVLRNFASFRNERGLLVERLAREPGFLERRFLINALSLIVGAQRGAEAADWSQGEVGEAGQEDLPFFEAEWVQDIRPNYELREHQGRLCLALGEGAGGFKGWLKGRDGSPDIGSARFALQAPKPGRYRMWARVYFDDKCGNSFGLTLDGAGLTNFPDEANIMKQWHWLDLNPVLDLSAGLHQAKLEAWEDGVFIDTFALLPEGTHPDNLANGPRSNWTGSLPTSLSFSLDHQSILPGGEPSVTVWVRRSGPTTTAGKLRLELPAPFVMMGPPENDILFEKGNPLCRSSFRARLPADLPAGEGWMKAVFQAPDGTRAEERFIIGSTWGWLTTGPLAPDDPVQQRLAKQTHVSDADLRASFTPYPARGFDPYRTMNLEAAFGNFKNRFVYLCADLQALEAGEVLNLLVADDTAQVWIDGRLAIEQSQGGPGEGRMVSSPLRLDKGRHRAFVRVYQADFDDPEGQDRDRHSYNHCIFKWLIRKSRHEPTTAIQGLPDPLR